MVVAVTLAMAQVVDRGLTNAKKNYLAWPPFFSLQVDLSMANHYREGRQSLT